MLARDPGYKSRGQGKYKVAPIVRLKVRETINPEVRSKKPEARIQKP